MSDLVRNSEDRFSSDAAQFSVGGNWTDWTVWSCCSQTCGDGQMTRGRFCVNPRPANGGQDCVGAAEEQQTCNIGNCPGNDCVCFFVCVDGFCFCFVFSSFFLSFFSFVSGFGLTVSKYTIAFNRSLKHAYRKSSNKRPGVC